MVALLNAGGEVRVNTILSDQEAGADVTAMADGGYVITWQSAIDGSGVSISAQRYDAAGHRIGSEVLVNTYTTNDQYSPHVAGLADGGYVIVWESMQQDGSLLGVYQQKFDAFGNRVGAATLVNTTTSGSQNLADVTALNDGGYLITWQTPGDGTDDIHAQRYDGAGNKMGVEFTVNSQVADLQFRANAAGLVNGGVVVTWTTTSNGDYDIHKQQYDDLGNIVGNETLVNTTTAGHQLDSSVAALADGGYVIAWMGEVSAGNDDALFFQRYDALGNTVGQETEVAGDAPDLGMTITGLDDGGFAIAYVVRTPDFAVAVQRFDADSHAVGPATMVETPTDGDSYGPTIAGLGGGGYIVAWQGTASGSSSMEIYDRLYAAAPNTNGNQYVYGTSGADTLDGGSGADHMYGGQGDDVYVIDNTGDVVMENANEGTDLVMSGVTWTLGDNLENLTLTGSGNINGTGNALDNILIGNNGTNILMGLGGNDTLQGGLGNDLLEGGSGDDWLEGGAGNDVLDANETAYIDGGSGNDNITGGFTSNTLYGGDGDDVIQSRGMDHISGGDGHDLLSMALRNGGMTVDLNKGVIMQSNMLAGYVSGIEDVNGSAFGDTLTGDSGMNILHGSDGNDVLEGGLGDDSLYGDIGQDTAAYTSATAAVTVSLLLQDQYQDTGSAGSDYLDSIENLTGSKYNDTLTGDSNANMLDGGAGADVMKGGLGDDTYVVGNSFDNVGERLNEGMDTVLSSITYTLPSNVEILTLTGTANLNATGNSDNNTLNGNAGNNLLDGGAGADKMYGGLGDDTYVINNSFDQANENANEGTDTVQSSITFSIGNNVENLTLTGTAAINGTGNALANIIAGNSGNNVLKGGAGNDTFVFGKFGAANGLDHLVDFVTGADHLSFTGADYGIAAGHHLTTGELSLTGTATSAAGVGQFVYNTTTHTLSWDSNGVTAGGVTAIVVFDNSATPHAGDFIFT